MAGEKPMTDLSLGKARKLYAKFAGQTGDDAIQVMAQIALVAKSKQTGWGKLRLEALRELGRFLIRNGRCRGRPAKTSADEDKLYLADLGIIDHHLSSDAKKVARITQKDFYTYLGEEDEPTLKGLLRFGERHSVGVPAALWARSTQPGLPPYLGTDDETTTTEWWTPREIFDAMGSPQFDLDVCSPGAKAVPWIPAKRHLTKRDNGLTTEWGDSYVWMNAPFGLRNGIKEWVEKFVEHGNGVALVPDFTSTEWWQVLADSADALLFVRPKIQFLPKREDGRTNLLGSTLVAIGNRGVAALQNAERNGRGICFRRDPAAVNSSDARRRRFEQNPLANSGSFFFQITTSDLDIPIPGQLTATELPLND